VRCSSADREDFVAFAEEEHGFNPRRCRARPRPRPARPRRNSLAQIGSRSAALFASHIASSFLATYTPYTTRRTPQVTNVLETARRFFTTTRETTRLEQTVPTNPGRHKSITPPPPALQPGSRAVVTGASNGISVFRPPSVFASASYCACCIAAASTAMLSASAARAVEPVAVVCSAVPCRAIPNRRGRGFRDYVLRLPRRPRSKRFGDFGPCSITTRTATAPAPVTAL